MRLKILASLILSISAFSACAGVLGNPQIPLTPEQEAKIQLGKMLWFDKRLSLSGDVSCNTCHNVMTNGADTTPVSVGYKGQKGGVNSPTVFNAEHQVAQFWDGRASDLKQQAEGPLTNPVEMALTPELTEQIVNSIPGYAEHFKKVFGSDKATFGQVAEAIAAFETTLVTPNSPFERYMKGEEGALTPQQVEGFKTFRSVGCVMCHSGALLGGSSFQKMGAVQPYHTTNPSKGRADVTGKPYDEMMFKVPILLNVERTAPYFHDGSTYSLPEAVDVMAKVQLDKQLTPKQVADITEWLKSLNGELPKVEMPQLPADGPTTQSFFKK